MGRGCPTHSAIRISLKSEAVLRWLAQTVAHEKLIAWTLSNPTITALWKGITIMKFIRTSQLVGPALDWAVATCEAIAIHIGNDGRVTFDREKHPDIPCEEVDAQFGVYSPSTILEQGTPIIERERMILVNKPNGEWHAIKDTRIDDRRHWEQHRFTNPTSRQRKSRPDQFLFICAAVTPLLAAMRCHVAARLGDEIAVPDELLT